MAEELEQFDDPGLNTAVRRAWGGECCPFALRRRVMDQVGVRAEAPHTPGRTIGLRPLFGLAAAALALLAVGLVWHPWQHSETVIPTIPANESAFAPLPVSLASDLTYRHDECSSSPSHADSNLTQNDPVMLGQEMQQELHFPVLTTRLPNGWSFRGAAFCPVGERRSAHLIYFRSGTPGMTVSVFSLPPDVWPGDHALNCAELARGDHAVAGILTKKGFYCLVGSAKPPVPLSEIRGLLDDIWPQFAQDDDDAFPGRVTIANR